MPTNLFETIKSYITPDVIERASAFIGESPSATQKALDSTFASILAGLINRFAASTDNTQLLGMVEDRDHDPTTILRNPASAFAGGPDSEAITNRGQSILRTIFGDRIGAVANAIAADSGTRTSSAQTLLSLAAPIAMGVLAKVKATEGLDARGLVNLLASQRESILRYVPAGVASALGLSLLGDMGAGPSARRAAAAPPTPARAGLPGWLWAAVGLLILFGLIGLLRGPRARTRMREQAGGTRQVAMTLPDGVVVNLAPGTADYDLAKFLADTNDTNVPRTFVIEHIAFDTGTSNLTPASQQTVHNLAEILKAYPNAKVSLEDASGAARTGVVKNKLEQDGVNGSRVEEKTVAPSQTVQGRGLVLVVLQK